MKQNEPRLPTKVKPDPDWELLSVRAPLGFNAWFKAERARRAITSRGLVRDMWDLYERLYTSQGKRSWED